VYLVLAPFAALAALFGMLFISFGQFIMALEVVIGRKVGGETVKKFGVKSLPDFYF